MNTEANVKGKSRIPICVKVMLIIFVILGIVGGLLCWLL